jgi:hypothetical protein
MPTPRRRCSVTRTSTRRSPATSRSAPASTAVPASTFTETAADECDAQGWYGEETLDVESVHGQAPNANVLCRRGQLHRQDLPRADAYIVNNHLASIVTDSWGEPYDRRRDRGRLRQVFQAGAAEGIGFFFSSGDSGYESRKRTRLGPDPGRLPGLQPVGHLGRRHQPGHRPVQELRVRDLVGHAARPAGRQRHLVAYTPPGEYPDYLRRFERRRREHRLHPAVVPGGRGADSLATSLPTARRAHPDARRT